MKLNKVDFLRVVPKDRLQYTIEFEKVDCSKGTLESMFDGLYEKKQPVAESIYSEYQYAGKTSVNIFEALNFPTGMNNKQAFLTQIHKKLAIQSSRVTGVEFRPEITEIPQVNYISEFSEDELLIQWVSGKMKPDYIGYDIVERIVPKFEVMIIRFGSPVFVELRSGYNICKQYLGLFQQFLTVDEESPVLLEWAPLTHVTEKEAEQIAGKLNAGLLESEHLGEGCIGRLSLSAAPGIDDLKQQAQYTEMVAGRQYLAQVFNVDYTDPESGYTTKIKFRINMSGGFEFKSKVSERIIRRILDVFVEVRYMVAASRE